MKGVMVAYGLHLLIPLAFIADVALAWRTHEVGPAGRLVLIGAGVWVVGGLTPLLGAERRHRFLRWAGGPLLAIYATCAGVILAELLARVILPGPGSTLFPPGFKWTMSVDLQDLPGLSSPWQFSVNEIGLRGPALPAGDESYKIIAIGGSTTNQDMLDDAKTWTALLAGEMRRRAVRRSPWIASAGVDGHTTVHHLALVDTLPALRHADMLTFLIGINDLYTSIAAEARSTQETLEKDANLFVEYVLAGAVQVRPYFKRLQLYRLARRTVSVSIKTDIIQAMTELRRLRAAASQVSLPDLHVGVSEYRERIVKLARACQTRNVRCLFLTQPSVWRHDLTDAERARLWVGWVGPLFSAKGYVAVDDLVRAMDLYNRTLLDVCRQHALECYDLAADIPRDFSHFYDDVHFNEGGARIVARSLAEHLAARPPFRP